MDARLIMLTRHETLVVYDGVIMSTFTCVVLEDHTSDSLSLHRTPGHSHGGWEASRMQVQASNEFTRIMIFRQPDSDDHDNVGG